MVGVKLPKGNPIPMILIQILPQILIAVDLSRVNFTLVDLGGRDFTDTLFTNANLTKAKIFGCKLPLDCSNVNFSGGKPDPNSNPADHICLI